MPMTHRASTARDRHARRACLQTAWQVCAMWVVVVSCLTVGIDRAWGWARSTEPDRPPGLAKPEPLIRGARDLLKLYGMTDERLGQITDGDVALVDNEDQQVLLLRMLIGAKRFSLGDLRRYAQPPAEWSKTLPASRGELYNLRGHVTKVETIAPPERLAERFELPRYYRCEVELDGKQPAVIYALQVPKEWQQSADAPPSTEPLRERIGAAGFLVRSVNTAGNTLFEFTTQRLAWYPAGPLGDLEADAGLFETVRNNAPLEAGDTESFYDMLAACGRVTSQQLIRMAPETYPVATMFPRRHKQTREIIEPQAERGELIKLTGTAQRAVKIHLEDPDKIAAYGFDHYFEVEVWHADVVGNPIVFCLRKLPKEMPVGERIAVDVTVAGFFLKTWAYRINKSSDSTDEKTRFQIAPLLIGREALLVPREPPNPYLQLAGGLLFAVAVVGAWIGVAWSQREDKKFHDRVIRRVVIEVDGPPQLDGLAPIATDTQFHDYHNAAPLLPTDTDLPQIVTDSSPVEPQAKNDPET